jgi:hypothetical protein
MSDIKTEVIVNGSWRASCDMCFQGIDEDTSSVRVLLLYCLWESTGARACTPFDSRSLLRCSSARHRQLLYVAYLHAQTDLYYIFLFPLFTPFFFQFNWWRRNWVRYLCVRQSIVHTTLARFFSSVHMAGNATKRMRTSRHWLWSVFIVIISIQ